MKTAKPRKPVCKACKGTGYVACRLGTLRCGACAKDRRKIRSKA